MHKGRLPDGSVVLVEIRRQTLTRVYPDGRKEIVAKIPGGPNGAALGPDGKMFKTRSGETVGLLEVIDEAIERSRAAAEEKEQGLSDAALDATDEGRKKLEPMKLRGFMAYDEKAMLELGKWLGL